MGTETKEINNYQGEKFKKAEMNAIEKYLERYDSLISSMSQKRDITILDVGGGAGYFAMELEKRIPNDINLKIYVLDTHSYETWENGGARIQFVKGDALNLDKIFGEKTFDYIFCNMVFHHLLGDDFKSSAKIRETVLSKIGKALKDDGRVGIIEIYNDGFIADTVSCRIIYGLTTVKNPILVKLFRILGSYSAGVGVCMLSKKMWRKLISDCDLKIVQEINSPAYRLNIVKKIGILNRRYSEHNLMVLGKK